ncbi:MAG: hypothetical protein HY900_34010 [Deltaproteobacteria bacterium]|nr:hypothetical protein [Deltaproteobacteria bacterium]
MRSSAVEGVPEGWRAVAGSSPAERLLEGTWESLERNAQREAFRVEVSGGSLFVKRYDPGTLAGRVRDFVLRRKPYRSFVWGRRLAEAGFATPRPVALWLRGGGLPREALIVTEWLEDARQWDRHLAGRWREDPAAARAALQEVAKLLGRLHAQRFDHGDLRTNIVFAGPEPKRPFLIDLDDLWWWPTRARRVKNLQRMHRVLARSWSLGPLERELFFQAYGAEAGLPAGSLDRLGKEVFAAVPGPG